MEKEFDVKTVLAWTAPKEDGAPIIAMPNVPTPLHGCLEGETEVLTPNGWKRIDSVSAGDIIMCWKDGFMFFDEVQDTVKNYYKYAYRIGYRKRNNFDIVYSPDHRLPIDVVTYREGRDKRKLPEPKHTTKVYTAEEFTAKTSRNFYASGRGTGDDTILTADERLLIAIQADGNLHRKNSNGYFEYRIRVKKERKAERIRTLFRETSLKHSELKFNESDGYYTFAIWTEKESKTFSNVFSYNMNYKKARAFVEEVCLWDGNVSKRNVFGYNVITRYYCSTRKDNIDFVQAIAAQSGYRTNLRCRPADKIGYKDCWVLEFVDKSLIGAGKMRKEKIEYRDNMYCVTVPSTFFLIRYKGRVVVTGNCAPRTLLGQSTWEHLRKRCYFDANYKSQISGEDLDGSIPSKRCNAHELYSYDYTKGTAYFERAVCISPLEHNFIHSGRMLTMYKKGNPLMPKSYLLKAVENGFSIISEWNKAHPKERPLRAYATLIDYAKIPELSKEIIDLIEKYDIKFYKEDTAYLPKWSDWSLKIGNKEYPTPYKDKKEWAEAMGENDKTNHNAALSNVQKGGVYDEVDMILSQIDNEEI